MQPRGWLVEDEQIGGAGSVGQMSYQLEPLRFAAGQGVQWLTQPQITKPNFLEHFEAGGDSRAAIFAGLRKEMDRFTDRELKNVVNRFLVQTHLQHVRLETLSFAFRAAHIKIAQELHLDLFV